jgi:prephenate dehydrogenase
MTKIGYWLRSSGPTERTNMTKPRITIIGLGLIGGSIGLGLTAGAKTIHVVGHDIDSGQGKLAQKKVHESRVNLIDACQDADLVILAIPITGIRETLELIAPNLKQGCVVTDTATLKEPVLAWAAETLPDGVPFVGGDPLLNPDLRPKELTPLQGLEQARADLFQDGLYALCPAAKTHPTAVKRVSDMVNLLNARPFYVDPVEHDGMRAAVEGLPTLVGLALMYQVSESPGWQEARKLADHIFSMATAPLADDAEIQRASLLLNADHLLPRVDAMIQGLAQLREWIAAKNAPALEEFIDRAVSARTRWLIDRAKGDWDEELAELGISGTLGSLGNMFGFGSSRRQPKEE